MRRTTVEVWTRGTVLALAAAWALLLAPGATAQETIVYVELKSPKPTVVAQWEAKQAGKLFDAELHRASIRLAQDNFLKELTAAGVGYTVLSTTWWWGTAKSAFPTATPSSSTPCACPPWART